MWLRGLRIRHCQCSSSGCCCGAGSIPDLGISSCHRYGRKERKRERDGGREEGRERGREGGRKKDGKKEGRREGRKKEREGGRKRGRIERRKKEKGKKTQQIDQEKRIYPVHLVLPIDLSPLKAHKFG